MKHVTRRWCVAAALVLGFLATVPADTPRDTKRYLKLYSKGNAKMEAGRYEKAAAIWERMQPLAPENPAMPYGLATSLARLGRTDAAFAALDRAVDLGLAEPDAAVDDSHL